LSTHPFVDWAADPRARRASDFRALAAELTAPRLAEAWAAELAAAPHRSESGRKHFVAYSRRLAAERKPARDAEHLSLALVEYCRRMGRPLPLPDGSGSIEPVAAQVALDAVGGAAAGEGASEARVSVGRADLVGLGPDDRLAIVQVRYLPPGATRAGTGDTPLRALLEALALAAVASANRASLGAEIQAVCGRAPSEAPPLVAVLASPRYWELCRKREAQKGAAWIREIERFARELGEATGVTLCFLGCRLEGDPGWSYPEGAPVLDAPPRIGSAWEPTAGRVRPKPPPRPKQAAPVELRVEADPSRPVRGYVSGERYAAGDRIDHPKLGLGVCQGPAGEGKICVLFDGRKVLLVHGRGLPPPAPGLAAG
jgi:hypothetical protein